MTEVRRRVDAAWLEQAGGRTSGGMACAAVIRMSTKWPSRMLTPIITNMVLPSTILGAANMAAKRVAEAPCPGSASPP